MVASPYRIVPLNNHAGMFLTSAAMMVAISHEIENVILEHHLRVELYVGFQRFSTFMPQLPRYRQLAHICEHIYVWGQPDSEVPEIDGITFLPVEETHHIALEWFVIVDDPQFFTSLVAQEKTPAAVTNRSHALRQFEGVWTHDPDLVAQSASLVAEMLGRSYRPMLERDFESQHFYQSQMFTRVMQRREQLEYKDKPTAELDIILQSGVTSSETPMLLLDAQKHVVSASRVACDLLDVDQNAIVGKPLSVVGDGIFAHRDPTTVDASLRALLRVTNEYILAASSTPILAKDQHTSLGWMVQLHYSSQRRKRVPRRMLPIEASLLPYCQDLKQHLGGFASNNPDPRALQQAQQVAEELSSRIQRLALLHSIEAQGEVQTDEVDVLPLVKQLFNDSYITARRRGVVLQAHLPHTLPPLLGNPEQIALAVRELIANVVQHAAGSGVAHIRASHDKGYIHLHVQDRGRGLSQEDQERIFRPFSRLQHESLPATHVGFGLALARAVANAHRGHLRIESQPGEGSTFTLMLPMYTPD